MGVCALATMISLPSGLLNASRVVPVALKLPLGAAPAECASKARDKNWVTTDVVVGSRPAGMGLKAEGDPGAVSACSGAPGGATDTSD